jgi:hypothetical protein
MSTDNGGPTYWGTSPAIDKDWPPLVPGDPRSKPGYSHGGGANSEYSQAHTKQMCNRYLTP